MTPLAVYSFCTIVALSVAIALAMSMDLFVSYVNDILIPCQHDSVWDGSRCVCDNSRGVFGGPYCGECQCEHLGICVMTENRQSRWGCRCPSHQKWSGTLCDKCYAKEHTTEDCRGPCLSDSTKSHFGPKCESVCMANTSSMHPLCLEVMSGSGTCNACNGHGTCSDTGQCECFDGWFTTLGGEQCAASCADTDISCDPEKGTCTDIGGTLQCICRPGFYGSDCEDTCPGEGSPCSGHGTCAYSNAGNLECTCDVHYTNTSCNVRCPGDLSDPTSCSGHGQCAFDNDQATCECIGTWAGDACACEERFTCSGHGECLDDSTCACFDDSGDFETHWAGSTCERCQEHWFGANCHLRCDTDQEYIPDADTIGVNIGCNGHGTCALIREGDVEHITCQCADTDPDTFCQTCVPNYYPDVRLADLSIPACSVECSPETTCSNAGVCNPLYNGTNDLCICNKITIGKTTLDTLDPKQFCSTCKPNWFPSDMDSPNRCSHYCAADGKLQRSTGDAEQTFIYFGTDTPDYDLQSDNEAKKVCGSFVDDQGVTRYSPDPDCRVCSSEGQCRANGECKCSLGTTGVHCEISCGAGPDGSVCSNHGRCIRNDLDMWFNPYTEDYRCECVPYDTYTSDTRQRLIKRGFQVEPPPPSQYHGKFCEFHCPVYNEQICADRGTCDTTVISVPEPPGYRSCRDDPDCADLKGGFCARLASPWDSLMQNGKSFFSNGQDSPGYFTCATSENCIDSIYSIEWDAFCVNMLNGWYPNILNTPKCTYSTNPVCRESVEAFFTEPYNGSDTWCDAAMHALTPEIGVGGVCGTNSFSNRIAFENTWTPLCHDYTLETTCNAQERCIFDQTQSYIQTTDDDCAAIKNLDLCIGSCRVTGNETCVTKTYCRAKTCQDIMFEHNVESLCLDIPTPCSAQKDWPEFCANASGVVRKTISDMDLGLTSMETFYTCYMYDRRHNPQIVSADVPGSIPIAGTLRVLGEDVLVQEYRKLFIDSRIDVSAESMCGKSLRQLDVLQTDFCTRHLGSVVPSWTSTHLAKYEPPSWFLPWLVVCPEGPESLWDSQEKAFARIRQLGRGCQAHYKIAAGESSSWASDVEQQNSISYEALPWSLRCPNEKDQHLEQWDMNAYPDDASGCEWTSDPLLLRWGQSPWSATNVQQAFKSSCENTPAWVPIREKRLTPCDLGACSDGDRCLVCGTETTCDGNASVMCISKVAVNCLQRNRCQKGGNCFQPKSMLYQAGYLCDWTQNTTDTAVVNGKAFQAEITSRGIVTLKNARDNIPRRPNVTIANTTKRIHRLYNTSGQDITFVWEKQVAVVPTPKRLLPDQPPCDGTFSNWPAYCAEQRLGRALSTRGGFGLTSDWSGEAPVLSEAHIHLVDVRYDKDVAQTIVIDVDTSASSNNAALQVNCDDKQTDWYIRPRLYNESAETQVRTPSTMTITLANVKTCQFKARFDHVLVRSITVNGEEQRIPYLDAFLSVSDRDVYHGNLSKVSGYTSWSFAADGSMRVQRGNDDILPQTGVCNLVDGQKGTCGDESPPRGVRWHLTHDEEELHNDNVHAHGESGVRVHGWSYISDTSAEVANMQILNGEFTPIVSVKVLQRRLYVNDVKTQCLVPTTRWWHWSLDLTWESEQMRMSDGRTVYEQEWSATIKLDDCVYKTATIPLTSGTLQRTHLKKMAPSHHNIPDQTEPQCRALCDADTKCVQWSWTEGDHHCYLFERHCHQDPNCQLGSHTLRSMHSHKAKYFEVYNQGRQPFTKWRSVRVEPLLEDPLECGNIDPEEVDTTWREAFKEVYSPFKPDATRTCNMLSTHTHIMPGYETYVCGTEDCSQYSPHDLKACGEFLDASQPDVHVDVCSDEDMGAFMNLDWTSYCRYARSFDPVQAGASARIPFMGGEEVDMHRLCNSSRGVVLDAEGSCASDVPADWYSNCFERTEVYEEYCSDECLDTIQDMLSDNGPDDRGLCEKRKTFLNISGMDPACDCDLGDIVITNFCLMQDAYHDGHQINIPELYSTECGTNAPGCMDTLKSAMNRTEWRHWCRRYSEGTIDGVCSKTSCDCDQDEYVGVAGQTCELTCPSGLDDGREVACSGRNGQCFAVSPSEKIQDPSAQELAGEVRTGAVAGPRVPEWTKGPKPTMAGRCQCSMGSGVACSIPCDRCNNGTYGEAMASQYGICDSFNGICRGLAPFMRFNTKLASGGDFISYNTTAFETTQGVAAWETPEHFLFENDDRVVDLSLRYLQDKDGLETGLVAPNPILVSEERFILNMLPLFRKFCWSPERAPLRYLDNAEEVTFQGARLGLQDSVVLHTTSVPSVPKCTKIDFGASMYFCFSDGHLHAVDTLSVRMDDASDLSSRPGSLAVFQTGDEFVPQNGVTFTKFDENTLYAFGGQRSHLNGKVADTFDTLYRIDILRMSWTPVDVIRADWHLVETLGDGPAGQVFAPLVSFENELYVLSTSKDVHTIYQLTLPTLSKGAVWSASWRVPMQGSVHQMIALQNGLQMYVDIGGSQKMFTPSMEQPWSPATHRNIPAISHLVHPGYSSKDIDCTLSTDNDTVRLGGNVMANYSHSYDSVNVTVFTEEWITIDVNSGAECAKRVRNAIQWRTRPVKPFEELVSDATAIQMTETMDMMDRIYMHQGRWSLGSSMYLRLRLSKMLSHDSVMIIPAANEPTNEFLDIFGTMSEALFIETPRSSPEIFEIGIEGDMFHRAISVSGQYTNKLDRYEQDIELEKVMFTLTSSWSPFAFRLRLKPKFGGGYIEWYHAGELRSFALLMHIEDWMLSTSRDTMTLANRAPDTEIGWKSLLVMFGSVDSIPTRQMRIQMSNFLAYSSSHCSVYASKACPGILPYTSLPCSGRGRCNIGCQCTCEVAPSVLQTTEQALRDVDWRMSPFRGTGCEITCPGYNGYDLNSICSGRGQCQRDGQCSCPQGYTGEACQFQCPVNENNQTCSSHGGCGTKAFDLDSFQFSGDGYMDQLTATNRQRYLDALKGYYGSCALKNYILQNGRFGDFAVNGQNSHLTVEAAMEACHDSYLHQTVDWADEERRVYPMNSCIGVRPVISTSGIGESIEKYIDVYLRRPLTSIKSFSTSDIFECQKADCSLERSPDDDFTTLGLDAVLESPEYRFAVQYVHGQSTGETVFLVNGKHWSIDTEWTENGLNISVGTSTTRTQVASEKGRIQRFLLTIALGKLEITIYPEPSLVPDTAERTWLAPQYEQKYKRIIETVDAFYFYVKDPDTGQDRPLNSRFDAEYDCDREVRCIGIVEWPSPVRESWYGLLTESIVVSDYDLKPVRVSSYLKKMTLVYLGRSSLADQCRPVEPGQASFPTVQWKEDYDIPVQQIDLKFAQDNETSTPENKVIEVGTGMWTNCWSHFANITTKVACHAKSKELGHYGFAFSDKHKVCIVYTSISDPTQIKMNRFNSETRLSIFNPCNDESTKWVPT